jgi:two-component system response regulator HydG
MQETMPAWALLLAGRATRHVAGTDYTRDGLAAMRVDDLAVAAQTRVPVLITGGSSADRDACARFIHASGSAAKGPFVPHCRLLATWLGPLQDTDALRHQFDQARGGTLYIDDVVSLTLDAQSELLSGLTEHDGRDPVRIISGTDQLADGELATAFLDDTLFYRLNVIRIDLDGDFLDHAFDR